MNEQRAAHAEYIGYEYKDKEVPQALTSLYRDSYPCFGWEEDPNEEARPFRDKRGKRAVTIRFRRDRHICNKAELTRLQRNFDSAVAQIEALTRAETDIPMICAITMGIVGTAFMAGATFAVTMAQPPRIMLCILLAVPGLTCWVMPWYLYCWLVQRQKEKLNPLIEDKYDEIYEICERGSRLLL